MIRRHDTIVCRNKRGIGQGRYSIETPRIECIGLIDVETNLSVGTNNELIISISKKTEIKWNVVYCRPTIVDIQWNYCARQIRIRIVADL